MTSKQSTTYRHPSDEHLHLREFLDDVRRMLRLRRASQEEVIAAFRELASHILDHFQHEELGGFFAAVVEAKPQLSHRTDDLLHEHVTMREQLASLQKDAVGDIANDRWWTTLEEELEQFHARFIRHESAENSLLQGAYVDDIGTKD